MAQKSSRARRIGGQMNRSLPGRLWIEADWAPVVDPPAAGAGARMARPSMKLIEIHHRA
ncbi:hypothetical protein [Immundisolibacter cernigliae]|uniref:hypothetical protein n=1 Tax=Immundisolibacter cernigliae TaxID=1810504 RepID=UPI0013140064|nr:hypothetical protein [Immundisolibacter cernigliae]